VTLQSDKKESQTEDAMYDARSRQFSRQMKEFFYRKKKERQSGR
jgi:hypothetical protein